MSASNYKVLVLLHARPKTSDAKSWLPFKETIAHGVPGSDVSMSTLDDLLYYVSGNGAPVITDSINDKDITSFDLVIFRTVRQKKTQVSLCVQALQAAGVRYIDSIHRAGYYSKLSGDSIRAKAGHPVIPSFYAAPQLLRQLVLDNKLPFEYPMIAKGIYASKGRDNYLVQDGQSLQQAIAKSPDAELILQPYIKNDGDYRLLVLGGRLRLVIKRTGMPKSHLNNTSAGARAELVDLDELPQKVIKMAENTAVDAGLELAGVDVMQDSDSGDYYLLEVNSSPQLISGAFIEEKTLAFTDYLQELSQEQSK